MGETNSKIIIVGDFNTPLLTMGRLSSQEIKKKGSTGLKLHLKLEGLNTLQTFTVHSILP